MSTTKAAHAELMPDTANTIAHASSKTGSRLERVTALFIGIVTALLYTFTAAPGIVELFDDSLEFQYVAPTFGMAHPTGYPLYTILGGVWSRVLFPFGTWAWRMNLLSALSGAAAVVMVFFCANRLVVYKVRRPSILPGLTAAAAFAFGPVWWSQTTVAEVYALHGLLIAAILLTTVTIPSKAHLSQQHVLADTTFRRILLLCILIGLGLAHHRTTVLILPAVAIYLLLSVSGLWRPQKVWFYWLGGFLAPLALYLYLPIQASRGVQDLSDNYVNNLSGFLDHVLAREYTAFFRENVLGDPVQLGELASLALQQMGGVALLLALSAMIAMPLLSGRTRLNWLLLILSLIGNVLFVLAYQVADWQVFLIPAMLILALFAGGGVGVLVEKMNSHTLVLPIVGAAIVLLTSLGIWGRGQSIDRSHDWEAHQYAYLLAAADYRPNSRVIGLEGEMTALKYMQAEQRLASGVQPVTADEPAQRVATIATSMSDDVPTYITREVAGIEELYSFSGVGRVVRIWPRGQVESAPLGSSLDLELLDGRLRLQGYELDRLEVPGGEALELTLGWIPVGEIDRTLKVSLRLLDESRSPALDSAAQPIVADRFPLHQTAPSPTWVQGVLIHDVHYLSIPETPRAMWLLTIVYDAETGEELQRFEIPVPE